MIWVTAALAAPVTSYEELVTALEAGHQLRAVVHYRQCLLDHQGGPDVVGGIDFDGFEAFAKGAVGNPVGFVSTTRTRWVVDPDYGHVRSFARLKIYDDGRADVVLQYLDRKDKVVLNQDFGCALGENSGLTLFTD